MPPTVSSLNNLDAEQARYRALHVAALTTPLDIDPATPPLDQVPHIDADARLRAVRNALILGLDEAVSSASQVVGIMAAVVGLGAAVRVVAVFVGGVL